MFGEKHDIPHEFPEYKEIAEKLCASDVHFEKIYVEYHNLDTEIRRIEQNVEAVSDTYAEELKKKRVVLKDQIYTALRAHEASS
jgi:uncharacterized protein